MPSEADATMKQGMPWSIKGVEASARDAAKDAARRAGMTLGEWLNTVIAETAADREGREQGEAPEQRIDDATVEARLERLHRYAAETSARASGVNNLASILDRAIEQSRLHASQVEDRTAGALDSMVRWIERTDRQRRDELGSLAHAQERTSFALREALTLVTSRLDSLENAFESGRERELAPMRSALQRLESRIDDLGQRETEGPVPAKVAATLHQLEARLVDIAAKLEQRSEPVETAISPERIARIESTLGSLVDTLAGKLAKQDAAPAGEPERTAANGDPASFDDILAQIRTRQEALLDLSEREETQGSSNHITSAQFETLLSGISGLTRRLDELHQAERPSDLDDLRADLSDIAAAVRTLSPRGDIGALEAALHEIGGQVAALGGRLDRMQTGGSPDGAAIIDPKAIEALQTSVDEIRWTLGAMRDAKGEPDLQRFEQQLSDLAGRMDTLARREPDPAMAEITGRLAQLQDSLETRIAAVPPAGALEGLLHSLREKMDEASRPDGAGHSLDALERQISAMTSALERTDENFAALRAMEGSITELFTRIEETRRSTVEAAESAAQRAAEAALRAVPESARPEAPDRRTSQALEAVQDTMERIVDRLSMLESDITQDRERLFEVAERAVKSQATQETRAAQDAKQAEQSQNAAQKIAAAAAAAHAARKAEAANRVDARIPEPKSPEAKSSEAKSSETRSPDARSPETASPDVRAHENRLPPPAVSPADAKALAAAARASMIPLGPHEAEPAETGFPTPEASIFAGATVLPDDMLLEPGTGRPPAALTETAMEVPAEPASQDSAMSSFIASARMAAQSGAAKPTSRAAAKAQRAAEASAKVAAESVDAALAGAADPLQAEPKLNAPRGQQRRRMILLALAAAVLAAGTAQIARNVLSDGPAEQQQDAAPAPAPAPVPTPAPAPEGNRQGSALEAPATTQTAEAKAPTPAAPSLMDPKPQAAGGFTPAAPADKQAQAFVPPRVKDPETVGAIASQQPAPSGTPADPARGGQIQLADIPVGALPPALTKAAGVGQPAAIYEVASRFFEGRTLPRDAKSAAKWFERAASQGFAPAQYRLGSMYEKGVGVPVDPTIAKNWYRQAADRGNAKAMHNLGVLIAEGSGGKPDYEAAAIWFRKAADLGVRDSQYNLAILTARGLGVQQSLAQSYTWFALAAAQGDEDAARKRDEVASRLDATTLATAKAAADAFKPGKLDESANDIGAPAGGWEAEVNAGAGKAKPRN